MPHSPTARSLLLAALVAAAWMALRWPLPVWMLADNDWLHQLSGANQILHGEHPFIHWHTDYGPFRYYPSALAQWVFGDRTLSELLLVTCAYTLSYTLLFHLLWITSGRTIAAVLLVLALILAPRLFKYYVMLGPVACLWIAWRYIERPSSTLLASLAAALVVTGLFRIDFGAFAAAGAVIAVASGAEPLRQRARTLARLVGFGALFVAPWFLWLIAHGGLGSYLVDTLLVGPGHASSMSLPFPRFDSTAPLLSGGNAVFLLFLCYYALPPIAAALALWPGVCSDSRERRRILAAAAMAQAVLLHAAHRSDYSHLLQAIPLSFVLLAWLSGRALGDRAATSRTRLLPRMAAAAVAVILAVSLLAGVRVGGWPSPLAGQGLAAVGMHAMRRGELMRELAISDPELPRVQAIDYVRRCTRAEDRIVALPPWTAVYYFADRMFAGAQPNWSPGFFSGPADQQRWIDTVRRENVRVVLGDFSRVLDGRDDRTFHAYSSLVTDYVATHYVPVGSIGPIVVRQPLAAGANLSVDANGAPPCGRAADG